MRLWNIINDSFIVLYGQFLGNWNLHKLYLGNLYKGTAEWSQEAGNNILYIKNMSHILMEAADIYMNS